MRGRPVIPNEIKRAIGDGIHDSGGRIIGNEPKPEPGVPSLPDELKGDERKVWRKFTSDKEMRKTITKADREALILLCQTWCQLQVANTDLRTRGQIIDGKLNISAKLFNENAKLVKTLLEQFGRTPVSRSKISLPPEAPSDDLLDGLE